MGFPACKAMHNAGLHVSLGKTMKTAFLLLAIMTVTMTGVTYHAWRIGNERRDVALLAVFAGLFAVGSAIAALI
jgi:hypothetical protein